jgi:hypothetical protein
LVPVLDTGATLWLAAGLISLWLMPVGSVARAAVREQAQTLA